MSVVVDVMNAVSTAWVATTPPTRTTLPYHELDNLQVESVTTADRGFAWASPRRQSPDAVMPDGAASVVEYEIVAELFLSHSPYGRSSFIDALITEPNLLARVVEIQAFALPANCLFLTTEEIDEPEVLDDLSGSIISIRLRTRVAETSP